MKHLPNILSTIRIILSTIRIILSLSLLFTKPLSLSFYLVYIICATSDVLDGFIARKLGITSTLGAKLDSIGDLVMTAAVLIVIYPFVAPPDVILYWIALIALVRFLAMFIAFKKYKTFASIHTYSNKFTGIILFLFPLLLSLVSSSLLMYIICLIATLSAIEELLIEITSNKLELDRKSIFNK